MKAAGDSYGRGGAGELGPPNSQLWKRWDNLFQKQFVGLTTTPANVYRGKQALEFTLPKQEAELSDAVEKALRLERDALFLRYYSKYESPYDVVGSSHNGASISAHYNNDKGQPTPGIQANGTNQFLANLETWRGEAATSSPGNRGVSVVRIVRSHPNCGSPSSNV